MNASRFGVKRSKFEVTVRSNVLENALLLMRYLENYSNEFYQTFSVDAIWDKGERFSVYLGSKGQGHSRNKGQAGGGIQSSMLCVEF